MKQQIKQLESANQAYKEMIKEMGDYARRAWHHDDADEFAQGYECARAGGSVDDEPKDTKHDSWRPGFAWGAFDGLNEQIQRLKAENTRLRNLLDTREGAG